MAEQEGGGFDPSRYLTKLQGRDYLEVKWRLVWLRARHPDAELDTELKTNEPDEAVFKATIRIPGGGSASGWGSETAGDFRDFREKAETKAIGRALAALGFGTQFCEDHEFGAGDDPPRVVDTPVSRPAARKASGPARGPAPNGDRVSWSDFWPWVESVGFQRDRAAINAVIPAAVGVDDPGELKRIIEAFLKEPKAAS